MEFLIHRTSDYKEKQSPCEKAILKDFVCTQKSRKSYYDKKPEKLSEWLSEGCNHRGDGEFLKREMPAVGWFITLNTLEELLELRKQCGSRLIINGDGLYGVQSIDVYDSCIE